MFKAEIKMGNAAYRTEDGVEYDHSNYELIRNLHEIIEKLNNGHTEGVVMDINGNKVGEWKLEDV